MEAATTNNCQNNIKISEKKVGTVTTSFVIYTQANFGYKGKDMQNFSSEHERLQKLLFKFQTIVNHNKLFFSGLHIRPRRYFRVRGRKEGKWCIKY